MRRRWMAVGTLVLAGVWCVEAGVQACGDKFLAVSRGTRFQRAGVARRPASILVVAPQGSRLAGSVRTLGVVDALAKVGYTATLIADVAAAPAAPARGWDLVVREIDGPVSDGLGGTPSIVVVAWDAPKDAVSHARKAFDGVLVRPTKARAVVDAVDDALFARALRPSASRASN